ncbi:MAG: HNH nuclease family protein, partial [Pseudomonas sp.]
DQQYFAEGSTASPKGPKSTHKAFADLAALLKSNE